jgi:hypothetical protein
MNHLLSKPKRQADRPVNNRLSAAATRAAHPEGQPRAFTSGCELTCWGQCRYGCQSCFGNCSHGCASFCGRLSW